MKKVKEKIFRPDRSSVSFGVSVINRNDRFASF